MRLPHRHITALGIILSLLGCTVPPEPGESMENNAAVAAGGEWYNCRTREVWSAAKQAWCDRLEALKNTTYTLPGLGDSDVIVADLTDGQFENSAERIVVSFAETPGTIATGDLATGQNVTAAILSSNTGGSGIFVYLSALTQTPDGYDNIASVMLGDRVQVRSVDVRGGQIHVNLIVQGENDPFCCPTLEVNQVYALQQGKLTLVEQEEVGTVPHDPGRPAYTEIDPPADAVLTGDDPRLLALEVYGMREPVEGNFTETAVLVDAQPERPVVFLTQTGLLDDSVEGLRYRIEFIPQGDQWRIDWVGRQTRCYPGRGPQDWSTQLCS